MDEEGDAGVEDRDKEVGLSNLDGLMKLKLASGCLASGLEALWATLVWSWRKLKDCRVVMLCGRPLFHMRC